MDRSTAMTAAGGGRADRLARRAERLLRAFGDPRVGVGLLLVAGALNAAAAALPAGGWLLDSPPYLILLAAVLLSGIAGVAVRAPAAWREWRSPAPLTAAADVLEVSIPRDGPIPEAARRGAVAILRSAGYLVVERGEGSRWTAAGTRRGWSRFGALGSHLALVLLVLGAALGTAFSSETRFSLFPGEQALLDAPRPGFTDAVRLDAFDARDGADGLPRFDTSVTFLRDGRPAASEVLQVNRPGSFGGYLVHGWTYGPGARLRVTTLGGRPLLDAPVALDGMIDGQRGAFAEVPTVGVTLGVLLIDADANLVEVRAASGSGLIDVDRLTLGESARLGPVEVRLEGFEAYVTFLSRRDPGMALLFAGAALLVAALAVAFWLPRRRVTLRIGPSGLRLALRGEGFDRPEGELDALRRRIEPVVSRSP